jgi:para-nitrobenzyl esterase
MTLTASVEQGTLRGTRTGAVTHFRGIPFAEAARFTEPRAPAAWSGERDATRHGPTCPQPPSRMAKVMGPTPRGVHHEDCLTLSVSTPAVDGARRPVMVWLHGGAYVIGGSSYEWYEPDALVTEGDVIVVRASYRLGVFGFLAMPGVSPGNLGLLDMIAALRWVQRNIAAFGGDPEQVTVFGESAGAHAIASLMTTPEARGLFRRAILQSPHLGVGFVKAEAAARTARLLNEQLGGADPRTATVDALLAAQEKTLIRLAGPGGFNSTPAFGPIAGIAPLAPQADIVEGGTGAGVDVIIGRRARRCTPSSA